MLDNFFCQTKLLLPSWNFVRILPYFCTSILEKDLCQTKLFAVQNLPHQVELSSILTNFCPIMYSGEWCKFALTFTFSWPCQEAHKNTHFETSWPLDTFEQSPWYWICYKARFLFIIMKFSHNTHDKIVLTVGGICLFWQLMASGGDGNTPWDLRTYKT